MNRKLLGSLLLATILCWPTTSAPATPDSISQLAGDKSAPRESFSLPTMTGFIKYKQSYVYSGAQPLFVSAWLRVPARTECMTYLDFQLDLRDKQGKPIGLSPHIPWYEGRPIPPSSMQPKRHPSGPYGYCPYPARPDGVFPFQLNELYPDLRPGTYTLRITFRPRDGSVPTTELPAISFQIQ